MGNLIITIAMFLVVNTIYSQKPIQTNAKYSEIQLLIEKNSPYACIGVSTEIVIPVETGI
jgi:hypothetical protein